jgi:hypothetical protein
MWRQGHLQWHDPPAEFHETLPISSKITSEGHTDRQTNRQHGDVNRFTFLLPEKHAKNSQKSRSLILSVQLLTADRQDVIQIAQQASSPADADSFLRTIVR